MDFDELIPQGIQPLIIPQKNTYNIALETDYTPQDGDKFYFTIKTTPDNDYTDDEALLKKDWTFGTDCEIDNEGYILLPLSETDTSIDYGKYYYDIKLVTSGATTGTSAVPIGIVIIAPVTTLRA